MTRIAQVGAVSILSVFLFVRGILPAMQHVDTDFPNYFVSARLLAHGGSLDRLYDDAWFQQQIFASGINAQGKFSPYPPTTAFVMLPLVSLSPLNALRTWTVFNIGCLVAATILLSRATGKSLLWSLVLFLASGHALANNFRFGQFYLALTVLVLAGFVAWESHRETRTGILLGFGAALKYFPLLFVPLFILRREWRILAAGFGAIVLFVLAGFVFMGSRVFEVFISSVLGGHLAGNIQDPFSPTFQSWNSLFRRLFIADPVLNPTPLVDSNAMFFIFLAIVYSGVVALFVIGYRKASVALGPSTARLQFAFLNIAGMLILPASATYHSLLLILPVAIFLQSHEWMLEEYLILTFYVLIGFLPYSYLMHFQSAGILTILAYPRLVLTTGIFVAAFLCLIRTQSPQSTLERIGFNHA